MKKFIKDLVRLNSIIFLMSAIGYYFMDDYKKVISSLSISITIALIYKLLNESEV